MRGRCGILLLTALLAGASGCAGTALREDGTPIFGPRAWTEPPAPPQRAVSFEAARSDQPTDSTTWRQGLARYFPGLARKTAPESVQVASATKVHPTWFGLRAPKPATETLTYMTATREQLNRPGPSPTNLPVALQVPIDRASSDRQVTTTGAEEAVAEAPAKSAKAEDAGSPAVPVFGSRLEAAKPAEPVESADIANRMPPVPAVDPLDKPEPKKAAGDDPGPDDQTVKASAPEAEPTKTPEPPKPAGPPKPDLPTTQVAETSRMAVPTSQVLASPQVATTKPKPHVHPTSQVKPTPQVKPSPQGAADSAKTWKRPCLRRLVRKVCKMGEFADPPTAAPH